MDNTSHKQKVDEAPRSRLRDTVALPLQILRDAMGKVPVLKYAYGVVGVAACVAVISAFKLNYWVAVVGVVLILIFMPVLAAFAKAATSRSRVVAIIGYFSILCSVLLFFTFASLLMTCAFWNWPKPLRDLFGNSVPVILPSREAKIAGISKTSSPAEPTPLPKYDKVRQQMPRTLSSEPPTDKTAFVDAVTMRVVDKETHQPIRDASVQCETNEKPLSTDSDGEVTCNAPPPEMPVTVEIDARGYKHFHDKVRVVSKNPIELSMVPESK